MRYTSSHPRTFRSRIAKSIGVLVATALIATLGLPGTAQAQEIGDIAYSDDTGFTVKWSTRYATDELPDEDEDTGINSWVVKFTRPNGAEVSFNQFSGENDPDELGMVGTISGVFDFVGRQDLGTWWVEVGACFVTTDDDDETTDVPKNCPSDDLQTDSEGYTHGAWTAPMNFGATSVPGGVALTWTSEKDDHSLVTYQYSMDDGEKWKSAGTSGANVVSGVKPGEHTFMLRALSQSDNNTSTDDNEYGTDAEAAGAAASEMVTVPMPTPTLPEIAALFLAMLLLGSGAYLLRGRQSGGLTHA